MPSAQTVFQDDIPYLLHLVWFGLSPLWLQVDNFGNIQLRKDVVIATDSFIEPQVYQQPAQPVEPDVRVRSASQNLDKNLSCLVVITDLTIISEYYFTKQKSPRTC